jgi:hypothetical protein
MASQGKLVKTVGRAVLRRQPTRDIQWCPIHEDLTIKRGTNRCQRGRKRDVNCITTSGQGVSRAGMRKGGGLTWIKGERVRISIPEDRLSPMRKKHESTKRAQRS